MKTVYFAELTTRHFSFEAFDYTENQARDTMRSTLEKHLVQCCRGREEYFGGSLEANVAILMKDVEIREVVLGWGYRDRQELFDKYKGVAPETRKV